MNANEFAYDFRKRSKCDSVAKRPSLTGLSSLIAAQGMDYDASFHRIVGKRDF